MEVLKREQSIERITSPDKIDFQNKVMLWVIHADKIPPHLGVSANGLFFSLKTQGKDEALPVRKILNVLDKKSIAVVFYEINGNEVKESPTHAFAAFEKTIPGRVTCLAPLKLMFGIKNALRVKDLLTGLATKNAVLAAYGWNTPSGFNRLPDYTPEDIHERLKQLSNV